MDVSDLKALEALVDVIRDLNVHLERLSERLKSAAEDLHDLKVSIIKR